MKPKADAVGEANRQNIRIDRVENPSALEN
jgi:hypothetical protein